MNIYDSLFNGEIELDVLLEGNIQLEEGLLQKLTICGVELRN